MAVKDQANNHLNNGIYTYTYTPQAKSKQSNKNKVQQTDLVNKETKNDIYQLRTQLTKADAEKKQKQKQ